MPSAPPPPSKTKKQKQKHWLVHYPDIINLWYSQNLHMTDGSTMQCTKNRWQHNAVSQCPHMYGISRILTVTLQGYVQSLGLKMQLIFSLILRHRAITYYYHTHNYYASYTVQGLHVYRSNNLFVKNQWMFVHIWIESMYMSYLKCSLQIFNKY